MKSKATTYLLLAVVFAVWSVIGWKVLSRDSSGDEERSPATHAHPTVENKHDTLLLNYRDPFLDGQKATPVANVPDPGPVFIPLPPTPKKVVKHNVYYMGRICHQGVEHSLVEINNASYTMRVGDVADDYRLERIFEDSLYFSFDGERYCIKLLQ